jgi:hypothetical protein
MKNLEMITLAQNTTQKSISIVFCVNVIRHDSSDIVFWIVYGQI